MSNMDFLKCSSFIMILFSILSSIFGEDLQFRMSEENGPMTHVGNVMEEAGLQGQGLKYFLMNQGNDYEAYFSVNEATGNLTAVDRIDRETLCEFMVDCELLLEIAAQSATNAEYFTLIRVLVVIVDVNDHRPKFPTYSQDIQISEDVLTGATVTLDGARDRDTSAEFSIQSYELMPANPGENLPFNLSFSKNLDGSSIVKLKVTRHLNREVRDKYAMYVVAKDGGSPPLNGSLYVNVTITDINDNYPTFEQDSYNITVSEDVAVNTVIAKLTAYDLDLGLNGEVKYRLSPHQQAENIDHFVIDSVTGDLKVTKVLNYNTKSSYRLIVEAIDKGDVPLTTQTFVQVNVKDTGNNPPEIYVNTLPSGEYSEVTEYANIGAVVAYVAIVDNDKGGNGDVNCDVKHSKFGIQRYDENEYKVILIASLDRERNEYHTVTVRCSDKGNPPLSNTETFIVNVLDENDNPPKFIQQRYFTVIDENNEIGESLTTVSAYDFDIGNNSKIRYSVAPLSSKYAYVNPITGVVMANKVYDKESEEEGYGLSLTVYAIDHGSPSLTGTTAVLVTINDKNDESPKFVQSIFRFWIDENRQSGTYVGKIRANDSDRGINADTIYSLKATAADVPFVIFSDGTIKTNRELDREFKSEYTFRVKAVDAGNTSMSDEAIVKVFVEDLNDNKPIIYLPTPGNDTVFVPYMTSVDTLIYSVSATDLDDPLSFNSKISFALFTPNKTNYFSIDASSGDIFLSAPLSNSDLINRVFFLNVIVRDYGEGHKNSSASLHVVITASNVTDVILTNQEYEKNVLIVIVVASLTFVISVAILVTIFILRRIDIQRKENNARLKVLSENMYYKGTEKVDNLPELPIDINYTEKSKKEVSFSLEEDHVLVDKTFQRNNSLEHILLEPPPQYKFDGTKGKLDDSQSDMSRDSGGDSGKGGSDDDFQKEDITKYRDPRIIKRNKIQGSFPMPHNRYQSDIAAPAHEMTSFPFQTSLRHPSPITTYGIPMYYADDQQTSSSFQSGDSCASLVPNTFRQGKLTMNLRDNLPRDCVV